MKKMSLFMTAGALALSAMATTAFADPEVKEEYSEFEHAEQLAYTASDSNPFSADLSQSSSGSFIARGFEGISQYDVAAVSRSFIPPDTMGAVGRTQYVSFVNGGFAVFDKATGARSLFQSDLAFWAAAGQTGANGDSRVMFSSAANRWIALSFGNSVADIQIAVSNTADALGGWQSTKFTGFAGGTADYPTLAMDTNAVYIGTNNFNGAGSFSGTTLNVIPIASLLNGGAPTTAGRTTFTTPYSSTTGGADGGFAIQGVNSSVASTTGHVLAASLFFNDTLAYNVNFSGGTPTKTAVQYIGTADYGSNGAGRQPNAVPDIDVNTTDTITSNDRIIDTSDQRIGSSVWEVGGRMYAVYTATPVGGDHTNVHYMVVDASTKALLSEGDIGDGVHDYYQGSLAVNKFGQVVIAYNRSGSGADGKISILAQAFDTQSDGKLTRNGGEQLLKVSLVDDYHNGSLDGQVAAGRQRWGDYSSVTLDPNDDQSFWVIGEYAREYNNAAGGHPGGTGGSRWSTWITQLNVSPLPEPSTWMSMIFGFGVMGFVVRRRRVVIRTQTAA